MNPLEIHFKIFVWLFVPLSQYEGENIPTHIVVSIDALPSIPTCFVSKRIFPDISHFYLLLSHRKKLKCLPKKLSMTLGNIECLPSLGTCWRGQPGRVEEGDFFRYSKQKILLANISFFSSVSFGLATRNGFRRWFWICYMFYFFQKSPFNKPCNKELLATSKMT